MESHIPVLLEESMAALAVKAGGRYVDGTFGRGGHSREIARRGGTVLGIDRDDAAVESAARMGEAGVKVAKGNHGDLRRIANENGWNEVDGVLLDLGVSSPQLDDAGRGFSFQREGPLDMRMDRSAGVTAADIVNGEGAERLEEIFRTLGEEPQARRVAKSIVAARAEGRRFETTTDFADFVARIVGRHGAHHPATRVFQALRMAVNDEMGELERALEGGLALLSHGGYDQSPPRPPFIPFSHNQGQLHPAVVVKAFDVLHHHQEQVPLRLPVVGVFEHFRPALDLIEDRR